MKHALVTIAAACSLAACAVPAGMTKAELVAKQAEAQATVDAVCATVDVVAGSPTAGVAPADAASATALCELAKTIAATITAQVNALP